MNYKEGVLLPLFFVFILIATDQTAEVEQLFFTSIVIFAAQKIKLCQQQLKQN